MTTAVPRIAQGQNVRVRARGHDYDAEVIDASPCHGPRRTAKLPIVR